ncbi:hypothetical protein C480_19312 [Natrialba aegyptia DSM 13077]|uniref:Uncharacterized protein n=1 Tax=Natrialba aegyptia DSM 13077 TaxID=1227491 RepID=M0AP23_9EURY|nr:hypothetical protein C480_19312 [Natrialba aegyptia DSM 13077]
MTECETRVEVVTGVDECIQDCHPLFVGNVEVIESGFLLGFDVRIVPEDLQERCLFIGGRLCVSGRLCLPLVCSVLFLIETPLLW